MRIDSKIMSASAIKLNPISDSVKNHFVNSIHQCTRKLNKQIRMNNIKERYKKLKKKS